jgi:hypothetical protein
MSKKLDRFYTYAYLREDGTPYYIGKGSGRRVFVNKGRSCKKPKDKSRIIFLKQNLTEEEAFNHEKYMVAVFGRKDLGTGILHNKSDGGEGASGTILPKGRYSGENNPLAKKWKITFEDDRVEIIKSLQNWAIKNGYKPTSVRNLYNGNCIKKHKNIVNVEYYDENGDLVSFSRVEKLELKNKKSRDYYQKNIEKRREYNNEWARKNKDKIYNEKVKEKKRKYIEKNKEKRKEYIKGYREKNKEKRKEYERQYREKNRGKLNEYRRQRYNDRKEREWRDAS